MIEDDEEPTAAARSPAYNVRLALIEDRLKSGASTFGWIRATVVAALGASVFAVIAVIYDAGRRTAFQDTMAGQVAELRIGLAEEHKAAEDRKAKLEALGATLQAEQDRRAALEQLVRVMAGRRIPR